MNLQTDAVIANQAGFTAYEEKRIDGNLVRFVTTETRGLSFNRNIALAYSKADIIVFADDDQRFIEGYQSIIEKAFDQLPDAVAIKFYCESTNPDRPLSYKQPKSIKRATKRTIMSAGMPCFAVKRDFLMKSNLFFNITLGSGAEIYCGEDSVFLNDLIKKKAKVYLSPTLISYVSQDGSSWFDGYNERFFLSAGYRIYGILLADEFECLRK